MESTWMRNLPLIGERMEWGERETEQDVLNFISNSWVQRNGVISENPYQKLSRGRLKYLQKKVESLVQLSSEINELIAKIYGDKWLFLLTDGDGNVLYCHDKELSNFTGLFYAYLTERYYREELEQGRTIEADFELETCPLSRKSHTILVPFLDETGVLACIFIYDFYGLTSVTDEVRMCIQRGGSRVREYLIREWENQKYTQMLLDSSSDCTLILDSDYYVLYANKECIDAMQLERSEFVGNCFAEMIDEENKSRLSKIQAGDLLNLYCGKNRQVPVPCRIKKVAQMPTTLDRNACWMLIFKPIAAPSAFIPDGSGNAPFAKITGKSPEIKAVIALAAKVAKSSTTVLICGETGTGKELVAEGIHLASGRSGPFVPLNCGAFPRELLQSELFGYSDGAFTGAQRGGKIGKVEFANNGTLFLDEIGEMPLDMQVSLLRFLQEKTITPIGSSSQRTVDVRIIAATNRNLKKMVEEGSFREDLYYRLNVFEIEVPPLRERISDLPVIVQSTLQQFCSESGLVMPTVEKRVMNRLMKYAWPGNVRELCNVIERCFLLCQDNEITVDALPSNIFVPENTDEGERPKHQDSIRDHEAIAITNALNETKGNVTAAARLLGVSRVTLYKKIKKYQIETAEKTEE